MIKPGRLKQGDKVAVVSLSSGIGGDDLFRHRYQLGRKRLEEVFGLEVVTMPHTLRGTEYLYKHPQARAEDLMQAFTDTSVNAVFSMIGGDDTIRLLPYINFSVFQNNPKIFMGYSDTTVNHFMLYKAGLTSFYGPAVMEGFAENGDLHTYTVNAVQNVLFAGTSPLTVAPSRYWTSEYLPWDMPENNKKHRALAEDTRGYIVLQGKEKVTGHLLGGCIDVFPMLMGTSVWPAVETWENAILFIETSEECPRPDDIKYILRGMAAQGILSVVNGILVGKPYQQQHEQEYWDMFLQVIAQEVQRPNLPILANLNFGHCTPQFILPYGCQAEIDCPHASFTLLEAGVGS